MTWTRQQRAKQRRSEANRPIDRLERAHAQDERRTPRTGEAREDVSFPRLAGLTDTRHRPFLHGDYDG